MSTIAPSREIPARETLDALSGGILDLLEAADPEAAAILAAEATRQATTLELIASENHVSPAVMHTIGTWMTNKYAEGYPGKRYYGGCEFHDRIEDLARSRATELFGCRFANVQPHSRAPSTRSTSTTWIPRPSGSTTTPSPGSPARSGRG
jgi:glycine hydroxymethyltransferase